MTAAPNPTPETEALLRRMEIRARYPAFSGIAQDWRTALDMLAAKDAEIARLRDQIESMKAEIEGHVHNRFYDQRDAYFDGINDGKR